MQRKDFSRPIQALTWMLGFLGIVAALALLLAPQLHQAFSANLGFNAVILAVLAVGIGVNLRQVVRLQREVQWMEAFRRSDPDRPLPVKPKLLASMARVLASRERGKFHLTPMSMRSILDSVQIRLEEQRDLSRYLIGLLIFLGLLGTFWGLLITIRAVGDIIGGLSVGADVVAMFEALKEDLRQPLSGMATAFSTSLFGLAGSLIVGFLDLQSGHAQNRFYNELEEWLSGMARLPSGLGAESETSVPAYVQALLEQTAESLDRMQLAVGESERERRASTEQLTELNLQLSRLGDQLARESRDLAALAEAQGELRNVLRQLASRPDSGEQTVEALRSELRLLSRTLAAAVERGQRLD
jgi:hypothetical protein